MCSGSALSSRWRSWSTELAISAGEEPRIGDDLRPDGTAAPPAAYTATPPVRVDPRGSSWLRASDVALGTEPSWLTNTGIRVGGPASTAAAIPVCQSSSGTRTAASSVAAPGAGGWLARAAAAASDVGSGPLILVVFRVATSGNPSVPTGAS